ncbi:MAG: hypothetical protein LBP91_02865 [Coriobacteriales bacterium]|jgi:hypothetical protein|nr:hypothetical protein [Coriobacteriales bacterium]
MHKLDTGSFAAKPASYKGSQKKVISLVMVLLLAALMAAALLPCAAAYAEEGGEGNAVTGAPATEEIGTAETPLAGPAEVSGRIPSPSSNIPSASIPSATYNTKTWSLANLLLAAVGVCAAGILLIVVAAKKHSREKTNMQQIQKARSRSLLWCVVSLALGVAAVILFFATQNLSLSGSLVDYWTIVHVLLLVGQTVLWVLAFRSLSPQSSTDTSGLAYG